ncbi:HdeD family acid-resistance protein [Acinetobacter johnsonii]|uniref:HdeD family acid-resistance protein n=1 Tax=Acinetobacter johnsonii TaxID=40214 RepID=A0AA42MBM6_ACIJO|nr:HdeD family acid-resistance protein [Acinetobacter johnsonii]MDH0827401.1 HdeD family acid-resistance protein [Acinetobacter johnsonii]UIP95886.1 HdeD family acid-resistance protein [Acinetobacter johnsonii]
MPAEAVLTLTIVFGAYSFADGVLGLWSGYKNMRQGESWGWLIFSGLLGIATGLIVLVSPFVATLVLTVFLWTMVAFWSITSGVMEIVAAFRLRKEIEGEWLLVLSGVISILLGAAVTWVLFTTPAGSIMALGWLLGVYAAIFGVTMILLALKLRTTRWGRNYSHLKRENGGQARHRTWLPLKKEKQRCASRPFVAE